MLRVFTKLRALPGEYRVQVPNTWGGERDIVIAPGEIVRDVNIRPLWFIGSAMRELVFLVVFFLFTGIVLVALLYIVIRAFAAQPLNVPELGEEHNPLRLGFHGNGSSLFGIFVINVLLTLLTLGIYYFWGKAKIRRYMHSQTELHNQPVSNHTTGGELCIGWIKAIIIIVTIVLISEIPSFFWEGMTYEWITLLAFTGFCSLCFCPWPSWVPCVSDSAEPLSGHSFLLQRQCQNLFQNLLYRTVKNDIHPGAVLSLF